MAEEEAEEEGGEAAGEEEKKGLPIKLILIVVGVLALAGGGTLPIQTFFKKRRLKSLPKVIRKAKKVEKAEKVEKVRMVKKKKNYLRMLG